MTVARGSGAWIAAVVAAFLLIRAGRADASQDPSPWIPEDDQGGPGEGGGWTNIDVADGDGFGENPSIGNEGFNVDTSPSAPRLSAHFTVTEFVASRTALARGIDNDMPIDLIANAKATASMLERVRAHLSLLKGAEVPIIVTSGYRSPALNAAVGGSPRSDHLQALAADIRAPGFGSPLEVAQAIEGHVWELGIGQLVLEYPERGRAGWVHVSIQAPARAENRIITVTASGAVPGITAA